MGRQTCLWLGGHNRTGGSDGHDRVHFTQIRSNFLLRRGLKLESLEIVQIGYEAQY